MSYAKERDEFMGAWRAAGGKLDDARTMLRLAATHDRLATAACNGDYPADNGERPTKVCPQCECAWAPASFARGLCPGCRIEQRISALATACGFSARLGGDPRGYTVKIAFPNGAYNTMGGREDGWGVPVRSR